MPEGDGAPRTMRAAHGGLLAAVMAAISAGGTLAVSNREADSTDRCVALAAEAAARAAADRQADLDFARAQFESTTKTCAHALGVLRDHCDAAGTPAPPGARHPAPPRSTQLAGPAALTRSDP